MRSPGLYNDRPSSMVSPYWAWTKDMGYPELDIIRYDDGEWAIIEYLKSPIIPSLTRWNFVLTKLRNQEITYDFIKAYADQHCLEKHWVWDEQKRKEEEALRHEEKQEARAEDFVKRAHHVISNNPGLMDRISRNGAAELSLKSLWRQIPRQRLGKKGV